MMVGFRKRMPSDAFDNGEVGLSAVIIVKRVYLTNRNQVQLNENRDLAGSLYSRTRGKRKARKPLQARKTRRRYGAGTRGEGICKWDRVKQHG